MQLELIVDHEDRPGPGIIADLERVFSKPNDPGVLSKSPLFQYQTAAWTNLLYSIELRDSRLYCFVNSSRQLQVTVEPTASGDIRQTAQFVWDTVRRALQGWAPKLTYAAVKDTLLGLTIMTAHVSLIGELGEASVWSTIAIGVLTVFWVAIGVTTFARTHGFDMVSGAMSAWMAALVVLMLALRNRVNQRLRWQ